MHALSCSPRAALVTACVLSLLGCGDDDGAAPSTTADASTGNAGAGSGPRAGSGGSPSGGGRGVGTMSAVIDGMAWEATMASTRARIESDVPGGYELEGMGGNLQRIQLQLFYVGAEGDYDFGVTASVVGASANVSQPSMIWQTPGNGDAGRLTITTLMPDRIAGTFAFTSVPFPGTTAMGTKEVTDGEFDFVLQDEATPVGPADGSRLSATLSGADAGRFNAASVITTPYAGGVSFNAIDDRYDIGFILGEVTEPGTYALDFMPPIRSVIVVSQDANDASPSCCWGASLDDEGSITITTLDDERLVGSFEFTLAPKPGSPASEPLTFAGGSFDVGRGAP